MGQYELHVNGRDVYRGDSFDYPGEGQYAAVDITPDVTAGQPLALGVLYHYWTCTCQGRANGPASTTRLAAATAAGATTLPVQSVAVFDPGDQVTIDNETVTVTKVGSGSVDVSPAPAQAHASGATVTDLAGPSGMLVKAVVDHADGSRDTFVSDGTWKVAKAAQYLNGTVTYRNSDAGDRVERYDARNETAGWDAAGFDDSQWAPAYAIGAHPRPVNPLRDEFSHLDPAVSSLDFETVHPKSVTTLADGTVVADFGRVLSAHPQIAIHSGAAGRTLNMLTSYRLNNTTLAAAAAAGATTVQLASVSNFAAGDKVTIDGPADGYGAGDPEVRTIAAVDATAKTLTLDAPLSRDHASGRWVEGSRAGTSGLDTQGSNLSWAYTEKDGAQTARTFTYWGWRYLQISAPGEPLTADDISAVVQYAHVPQDRRATFDSDNRTLNDVFDLMQRSGQYSSQETFLDTPTREKGQFTGDTVDISFANMAALGDRTATQRAIREIVYSAYHSWKAASSGYCTSAQVPCSFASLGTPGRVNSVYPNGDNMRDIPDYTEFVPGWVWRYYVQSGDKATLQSSYATLKLISGYLQANEKADAGGLIGDLFGGSSSYLHGIIDWPAPMRYGYTFTNDYARTIHNAEAVDAFRATASAARILGQTADAAQYDGWADSLAAAMNGKLIRPDGLYTDGLSGDAGHPQIDNHAQQAQSYPVEYGIAPAANLKALGDDLVAQGMHQGPMTWHVLLDALHKTGHDDQIVKLLTDPTSDGPAKTLAEGGTYMWEQWDPGCTTVSPCTSPSQSSSESFSHGWGSWGVVDMLESLLGVSVTSPGAATIRIAPPALSSADLHHVSGSVWTQRGTVSVKWTRTGAGYVLDVHVPDNVKATVAIPGGGRYVGVGEGAPRATGDGTFTVGSGDTHFSPGAAVTGGVGGTVPPTLALTLGSSPSFGAFTPGLDQTYTATTTADVVSTAGDASLTAAGPVYLRNGTFTLNEPLQVDATPNAWSAPVSHAPVGITFRQHIGARDPLRTGTYSAPVTFTLSTTSP
jgi:hypothetical protein